MEDSFLASLPCPALTNYVTWAARMKVHLQARGLWNAIDDDAKEPIDPSTDRLALAAIQRGISRDTLFKIVREKTAKGAWQALRTLHLGTEPVMRAKARALRQELEGVRMKDPEPVGDFVERVTGLVFNIRAHGGEVEESYVVWKILRSVSPKFSQIALTIQAVCDLESMTVEDLVDRLKAYEILLEEEDRLMTHAEWEAEMKKRSDQEGSGGGGFKGRSGRGGRGRGNGCGDGKRSNDPGTKGRKFNKSKVRCYNCRDYGHFASECRKPNM